MFSRYNYLIEDVELSDKDNTLAGICKKHLADGVIQSELSTLGLDGVKDMLRNEVSKITRIWCTNCNSKKIHQ